VCTTSNTNDLDTLSPAERQQKPKQSLVCPRCGYDGNPEEGDGFRFLEDIACFRPVLGVRGGLLRIQGQYASGEGYDDGTNWRFECRRKTPEFCGHEWSVPEWLYEYLDWID
jgi:hypothetical protein